MVLTILHVVIMDIVHDDLTQIEHDLPEVDGFVHYDFDLPHLAPHQVLAEDNSQFEVRLHHLLRFASWFVTSLMSLCFLMFSIVFPNTALFMSLKSPS